MDWVKIVYSFILLVCGISIFIASSSRKSDERRKFISTKAQSYAFVIVFLALLPMNTK
ncbi:hypothetical protein [Priestia megaterium]|uniref:hypothetical protein n=1 Tax=Priestia megaterium TaxID=1404 RepID=UPI001374FFB0|nr:hypothetical protein [Priestia megaterium]MDH3171223.1 hypothetical protein [Priestia megaterium]